MRSEGFSFNSWGSGGRALFATRCFYVRNRPQPFATVRSRALRRCHWGKLLQVTFHGCVTCQFAPLFHCDLHENEMSRKKRDAFRCTGAAFCEIRSFLRSSIGISVWRVVFLGCWMWPFHWDLRFRVWHRSSVFVTSLSWNADFGLWECAQNGSKSFQTRGVVQILLKLTWDDIVTFRGRRRTLCGYWGVEVGFSWQAQGIVRLRCVTEVTFRDRRSTLCTLDVWKRKDSWPVQGIGRLWVVVEVNVVVTLGLAFERVSFGGTGIAKLLGRVAWCVCSDGCCRWTFGGSLVRNPRLADFDMWVLEEVSHETLVLGTWHVTFGGSLVRNARFWDLTRDFWRKSRTKRSSCSLAAWLLEEVSYEECALQECPTRVSYKSVPQ